MKRRILPMLPLLPAFALLFTLPCFADVVFVPYRLVYALVALGIALLLMCISAAIVLAIVFTRRARRNKMEENK